VIGGFLVCGKINIVMDVKKEITLIIKQSLAEFTNEKVCFPRGVNFLVEKPENENFGDYSSNIALVLFKNKGLRINDKFKTSMDLAKAISDKLNASSLIPNPCNRVEAVKPGFINFYLSKNYLFSQLKEILEKKEKFGSKNEDLNKKVVVEYSSPNIAKPFTVGHLRSTIIGNAIANLLQANGWKVFRDNHLGDWGTQFGKQIYAIKTWGDEKKIEDSQNPVKELVALYIKFHAEAEKNPELEEKAREWFKKLENGDLEAKRLWRKCVDWSLKEFQVIYEKLGIRFTENNGLGYGEAFFEDKIKDVLLELNDKKLLGKSDGAELIFFQNDKFPPLMITKKDGTTLYSTRDLATDKFRLGKYGKDALIINEVGAEQSLYFNQLFEAEKMLGWVKDGQRIHIKHGLYRFKDERMSTRKGNTIWLEDVLKEAEKRALSLGSEKDTEIARKVAIGAIKWNDLKRSSNLDIVFDWDEILNMQGDSGPYIQYAYARTQSVLRKTQNTNFQFPISNFQLESEELSLLRTICKFSEIVEQAGEKFAPNILCNYLFDLAQKFNLFYQKYKIIGSKEQDSRLSLTKAVGSVIKNGLNLLGISAPEKM